MVEQAPNGTVILTDTERSDVLLGVTNLARIYDPGRLEAITVVLELTTIDPKEEGADIHQWRSALAARRNIEAGDNTITRDITSARAALRLPRLDLVNVSKDPRNKRLGGVYRFEEDTILRFLEAATRPEGHIQQNASAKPTVPFKITAILDEMPDEPKRVTKTPDPKIPRRVRQAVKETYDQKRARELEEKRLAIQALENSLVRSPHDNIDTDKQVEASTTTHVAKGHVITKKPVRPIPEHHQRLARKEPAASQRRSNTELRRGLPSGFKESRISEEKLTVTTKELPWLRKTEKIPLALITLSDTAGQKFYFGSIVRGKLAQAAAELTSDQNRYADSLLYTYLPDFVRRRLDFISRLSNRVTINPIYYVGNDQGQRVYFMESSDKIKEMPVIMRIAVCDKAQQDEVLSVLTTTSRSFSKARSRL